MSIPALLKDRYETKEEIGRGAMGVVLKAFDRETQRDVAIKIVAETENPLALERFDSEWRTLGNIPHPTIVPVLDRGIFRDGNIQRPFFVMPLISGNTFEALIYGQATLPEIRSIVPDTQDGISRIVNIIYALCGGLLAAHKRKVIHRDLKPSNILILEGDAVQIIDFGVAHLADKQTHTEVRGTPAYIAPELITPGNKEKPSAQSDIFSVGAIVYEALTRIQPFEREDNRQTMHALLQEMPRPVSELNGKVNHATSKVIQRALAKKPDCRFTNAMEFAEKLQQASNDKLPADFDRDIIAVRVNAISDACGDQKFKESNFKKAKQLLDAAELNEGLVDPQLSKWRQRVEQALRRSVVDDAIEAVQNYREAKQWKEAARKLREVSELPDIDADLKASLKSLETQIESETVRDHQGNARTLMSVREFQKAREELEESRKIRPRDTQTNALAGEIGRREEEWRKVRDEKERLFRDAQNFAQSGEFTSALGRIDRIEALPASGNGWCAAWEDAYKSGRAKIQTESREFTEEIQKCEKLIEQGEFDQAAKVCDDALKKYPTQAVFTGLRLKSEEQRRKQGLEFHQALHLRLNNTADLHAGVAMVQEEIGKRPQDTTLSEVLKSIKSKRDLVESLLQHARQMEEQRDFGEALEKWKAIERCHPLYPSLDENIRRLKSAEQKARYLNEAESLLSKGEYRAAKSVCEEALNIPDFEKDVELDGIHGRALDCIWKSNKADEAEAEGKKQSDLGQFDLAVEAFRRALTLDPLRLSVRESLGTMLIDRAKEVSATDWGEAEPLIREAKELLPGNPVVAELGSLMAGRKQSAYEDDCLDQARKLEVAENLEAALEKIREGKNVYPNSNRFIATEQSLAGKLRAAGRLVETSPPEDPQATTLWPEVVTPRGAGISERPPSGSSILVQDVLTMAGGKPTGATPAKKDAAGSPISKTGAGGSSEPLAQLGFGQRVFSKVAAAGKRVIGLFAFRRVAKPGAKVSESLTADERPNAAVNPKTVLGKRQLAITICALVVTSVLIGGGVLLLRKPIPALAFVGTATVQSSSTEVRERSNSAGELILKLSRGIRVNVLDKPNAERRPFTRVQYVDGSKNWQPGYIRTSDLGSWSGKTADVEAIYVEWKRPDVGASDEAMRQFADELQRLADQFAGSTEAENARLEEAKVWIAVAKNMKQSGKPASDWEANLQKAEAIIQSIQPESKTSELRRDIAGLRAPTEGKGGPDIQPEPKQVRLLKARLLGFYGSEEPDSAEKCKELARQILALKPNDKWTLSILAQLGEYEK